MANITESAASCAVLSQDHKGRYTFFKAL